MKPGPLNEQEWEVMRSHDHIGVDITTTAGIPWPAVHIIASHHHKYVPPAPSPAGTRDVVGIAGRLLTIADAFDAMTSDRPYRKAMSRADAIAELRRCSGTMFDPAIAEHFIEAVTNKSSERSDRAA
jgi:HD-GYP domain-containing protein (c-di-GMP phosphodiesterase class II)